MSSPWLLHGGDGSFKLLEASLMSSREGCQAYRASRSSHISFKKQKPNPELRSSNWSTFQDEKHHRTPERPKRSLVFAGLQAISHPLP